MARSLKEMAELAEDVISLDMQIAQAEASLKQLKGQRHHIVTGELPKDMMLAGMDDMSVQGFKFENIWSVDGKFPDTNDDERYKRAVAELERAGASALLVPRIEITYQKGEYDKAKEHVRHIKDDLNASRVKLTESVNTQTLRRFGRECINEGRDTDLEALGLRAFQYTKVSKSKKS